MERKTGSKTRKDKMKEKYTDKLRNSRKKRLSESSYKKFTDRFRSNRKRKLEGSSYKEEKSKKKRRKRMDDQNDSPSDFEFLPHLVLMKIFSYLSPADKCRVGRVCTKWYDLTRSQSLWKQVTLQRVSPTKMIKILPSLPSSVTFLHIHCRRRFNPLWLPEILTKLQDSCPSLKTFILEGAALVKNLYSGCSNAALIKAMYESLNAELLENAYSNLKKDARRYYELEYCKGKGRMMNQCVILPELQVLSLRKTKFNTYNLFSQISDSVLPNIKVLDLTSAIHTCAQHIGLFSRMNFLVELYLARSDINDIVTENILRTAVKLKVLDLEHTDTGDGTISALKRYGQSLEKLYLANTNIQDFHMTYDDRTALPRLHTLCIRSNPITSRAVENLLSSCRSLTCVDVSLTKVSAVWLENLSETKKSKLVFETDAEDIAICDHFKKSRHFHEQYSSKS